MCCKIAWNFDRLPIHLQIVDTLNWFAPSEIHITLPGMFLTLLKDIILVCTHFNQEGPVEQSMSNNHVLKRIDNAFVSILLNNDCLNDGFDFWLCSTTISRNQTHINKYRSF